MDWVGDLRGRALPARRRPVPVLPAQPKASWQPGRVTKPPAQLASPAPERRPADFAERSQARQDAAPPQDAGEEEPAPEEPAVGLAAESERLEAALGEPVQPWAAPGEEFLPAEPET